MGCQLYRRSFCLHLSCLRVAQEALSAELNQLGRDYDKGSEEETSLNTAQKETSNQTTVEHREIQR